IQWASVFSWGKSFISHYLIKAFDNLQPAVHHLTMAGNTAKIHVVLQGFKNDHGGIAFFYHGLTAQIQRFHDNVMSHQRSEEHTSELQSLMRISYAVSCL